METTKQNPDEIPKEFSTMNIPVSSSVRFLKMAWYQRAISLCICPHYQMNQWILITYPHIYNTSLSLSVSNKRERGKTGFTLNELDKINELCFDIYFSLKSFSWADPSNVTTTVPPKPSVIEHYQVF